MIIFDWPHFADVPADPPRMLTCYGDLASILIEKIEGLTVLVGQSIGEVVATIVAKRRPDLDTLLCWQ